MINQFLATTDAVSHSSTFVFSAPIRSITINHVLSVRRPVSDSIAPRPLSPQASQQSSLTSKVPKTNMPGSGLRTSLRRPRVNPCTANSPTSLVVKSVLHLISSSLSFLTSISLSLQYVLYTSTTIFLVGSALCGAAQVRPSGSPLK